MNEPNKPRTPEDELHRQKMELMKRMILEINPLQEKEKLARDEYDRNADWINTPTPEARHTQGRFGMQYHAAHPLEFLAQGLRMYVQGKAAKKRKDELGDISLERANATSRLANTLWPDEMGGHTGPAELGTTGAVPSGPAAPKPQGQAQIPFQPATAPGPTPDPSRLEHPRVPVPPPPMGAGPSTQPGPRLPPVPPEVMNGVQAPPVPGVAGARGMVDKPGKEGFLASMLRKLMTNGRIGGM